MSDYGGDDELEYDFDDDDDAFYYTEEPVYEADDLAEHTMHSPVWNAYDVTCDTAEIWTEWEYYTDEFFDEQGQSIKRKKRWKMSDLRDRHGTALEEGKADSSTWPTLPDTEEDKAASIPIIPMFDELRQEKVALLKDWRVRFKGSLAGEQSSMLKRHDNIMNAQVKGARKRKVEAHNSSTESSNVEMPSRAGQPKPETSSYPTRAPRTSKLRHQVPVQHEPMTPPESHTEDLSTKEYSPRNRKRLEPKESDGNVTANNAENRSVNPTNTEVRLPASPSEAKPASRKRKVTSAHDPPSDHNAEDKMVLERDEKGAVGGARRNKRLKR